MKRVRSKKFLRYLDLMGLVVLGVVLLCLIIWQVGGAVVRQLSLSLPTKISTTTEQVVDLRSAFNGEVVLDQASIYPHVAGAMIDNYPTLRGTQFGLAAAGVVYEAPVEGGITRLFALFANSAEASRVGPIRSARPYFIDWLQEYGDALYLHSGGSPAALEAIQKRGIFDANEFGWGRFYWRDDAVDAPHNLYTKSEFWQAVWDKYGSSHDRIWDGWKFATSVESFGSSSTQFLTPPKEISIRYASNYVVNWRYVSDGGIFERYLGDKPWRDGGDGGLVTARNVIVQYVDSTTLDSVGRQEVSTVGSGDARVYSVFSHEAARWEKKNTTARTRFFDENGGEIQLLPGKTWIQIVPSSALVTITR